MKKATVLASLLLVTVILGTAIIAPTPSVADQQQAFSSNNQASQPAADTGEATVYVTKTGKKYHSDGCRYLKKSKIPMKLSDAKKSYTPCSVCNPPQ